MLPFAAFAVEGGKSHRPRPHDGAADHRRLRRESSRSWYLEEKTVSETENRQPAVYPTRALTALVNRASSASVSGHDADARAYLMGIYEILADQQSMPVDMALSA